MPSLQSLQKTTLSEVEKGLVNSDLRPYLGMSQLGHHCPRYLWYGFRWAYQDQFPHRIKRLFARGHREEPEIIKELERVGIKCDETQLESICGDGHIKGHCDGIAKGVLEAPNITHLLEFKTMSDKYFKQLSKTRSVELSKFIYYVQCQLYMHFLKLKRTLFIAVNKNDDSWYVERINYNKAKALEYVKKGEDILVSKLPVSAPYPATFWKCKFCPAKEVCRNTDKALQNCRTCKFSELMPEGKWQCKKWDADIPEAGQRKGCTSYKSLF